VWAVKDPTSGNLDRIQIVKGWTRSGQSFEKVFDVVWAGDRKRDKGTGVVPADRQHGGRRECGRTPTRSARWSSRLIWTDPEFDPSLHAFLLRRVLEIPTPRWTTIQAKQLGVAPPDVVPATVPGAGMELTIWYTPSLEVRRNAKPVSRWPDLKSGGATPSCLAWIVVQARRRDLGARGRSRRRADSDRTRDRSR